jgi:hypothetical protein
MGKAKNCTVLPPLTLSVEKLKQALVLAENGEPLKAILNRFTDGEGHELKLRK